MLAFDLMTMVLTTICLLSRRKRIGSPYSVSYRALKIGNTVSSEVRGGLCEGKFSRMEGEVYVC